MSYIPPPIANYLMSLRGTDAAKEVIELVAGKGFRNKSGNPLPYWMKVLRGFDPLTANGYGIDGPFVTKSKLKTLMRGERVLLQYKEGATKKLVLMVADPGSKDTITFPSGKPIEMPDVRVIDEFDGFDGLFELLDRLGLPKFTAVLPEKKKA